MVRRLFFCGKSWDDNAWDWPLVTYNMSTVVEGGHFMELLFRAGSESIWGILQALIFCAWHCSRFRALHCHTMDEDGIVEVVKSCGAMVPMVLVMELKRRDCR